jgi:predicted ATPase
MDDSTFITRVRLKNYKSIAECDVRLGPLQFLVGPNGSGKSNSLDAFRLISDGLSRTFADAVSERGGTGSILNCSAVGGVFEIHLDFRTRQGISGSYLIQVDGRYIGRFVTINREELSFKDREGRTYFYSVDRGNAVRSSFANPPAAGADSLYLVRVSGIAEFRPVHEALSRMEVYHIRPEQIRDSRTPSTAGTLARGGGNLTSVFLRLQERSPEVKTRIEEYLRVINPAVQELHAEDFGAVELLQFFLQVIPKQSFESFIAMQMSDGTLRALGVLVALFQSAGRGGEALSLVGMEEPELALHPAAAGVLRDALREASENVQVIVTSHSPDLLDDKSVSAEEILAVSLEDGATIIGPLDSAGREAIRTRLYTPGELLRMNQLQPEPASPAQSHTNAGGNGA